MWYEGTAQLLCLRVPPHNAPVERRTKHQNTTYSPAHSISKQGSRYGPLVCPSKPSSRGLQRICSWHPDMRHSQEKGSSQRNHHIERGRRRSLRVEIAFILGFIYWLNYLSMKEGRKLEYPEKTPGNELQKMPHTKAWKFKPQVRLKPAL